jgi:hypothetical protein
LLRVLKFELIRTRERKIEGKDNGQGDEEGKEEACEEDGEEARDEAALNRRELVRRQPGLGTRAEQRT